MSNFYYVRDLVSSTRKGITPKYTEESEVLVLNQKCIRNNSLDLSFSQYHNPEKKFSDDKKVRVGDILINSTGQGTAGRCVFVKSLPEGKTVITDSHILIVRVNDFYTAGCLEYSLFSIENLLQTFMDGSTGQGEFDKQRLFNILTGLPSKEKRKETYQLLNYLDQKIELNNRINAELEAMAKTLYDYWFVQFDFPTSKEQAIAMGKPELEGKPYKTAGGKMVYNPTLKREIPEGWKVKKLADVTSLIRRGISPKYTNEGGISVLNQKCIREQKISFEDARRHKTELDDKDERLLRQFDVVVNSTGVGTLGRVAFVKRLLEKKTTVDSHVSIVRAESELVSPQYLAWKLMRHQPVIESAANGSTGQVELSKSFLKDIDIIIPSDLIIKRFEEFVTPLVPELAARESGNEQLVQLRDWLLPMLMNGQVTVWGQAKC